MSQTLFAQSSQSIPAFQSSFVPSRSSIIDFDYDIVSAMAWSAKIGTQGSYKPTSLPIVGAKAVKTNVQPLQSTVQSLQSSPAKACCSSGSAFCALCEQKGRIKISETHCDTCCKYCEHCDKRGHNMYHPNGDLWCLDLIVCGICEKTGHTDKTCLRDWCETCRSDGLGHNFVGHTVDRCRKHHVCNICSTFGHYEENCRHCSKCDKNTHTTAQCEIDTVCDTCLRVGHSSKRCTACELCGFSIPKTGKSDATAKSPEKSSDVKSPVHKCKRNPHNNKCLSCDSVGTGKCECHEHVVKNVPKKR